MAAAAGVDEAPAGILMGLRMVFRRFGVGGCLDAPCRWGLGAGFGSGMKLRGVDGGEGSCPGRSCRSMDDAKSLVALELSEDKRKLTQALELHKGEPVTQGNLTLSSSVLA